MSEAYIEINLKMLEDNIKSIKSILSDRTDIIAVVKGNAYGHGVVDISKHLNSIGIFNFAVSSLDEAVILRENKIEGDILVFGYTNPKRALELEKYSISQTIVSFEYAEELQKTGIPIKCHLKVDTGMNRQGVNCGNIDEIIHIFKMKNLNVSGIYSHLSASDSLIKEDIEFTQNQISKFDRVVTRIRLEGFNPKAHIQSSYGALNYNKKSYDFVRIGILMYGSLTSPGNNPLIDLHLKPILSLKAPIVSVNKTKKGDRIGYGNNFIAERDMITALIPIGYTDGIDRSLSFKDGEVLIKNKRVKIVGKISMDNMIIDITDIGNVNTGDIAVLIGKDESEEITAIELAEKTDSITPEIFSSLSYRLDRITLL